MLRPLGLARGLSPVCSQIAEKEPLKKNVKSGVSRVWSMAKHVS